MFFFENFSHIENENEVPVPSCTVYHGNGDSMQCLYSSLLEISKEEWLHTKSVFFCVFEASSHSDHVLTIYCKNYFLDTLVLSVNLYLMKNDTGERIGMLRNIAFQRTDDDEDGIQLIFFLPDLECFYFYHDGIHSFLHAEFEFEVRNRFELPRELTQFLHLQNYLLY